MLFQTVPGGEAVVVGADAVVVLVGTIITEMDNVIWLIGIVVFCYDLHLK